MCKRTRHCSKSQINLAGPCSVVGVRSECRYVSDCRSQGREFDLARSITFMEIDHEIITMAILLPSAYSRRVLSVTSESMCTKY